MLLQETWITSPVNLPAPGTCHTLYIIFSILQSAVFLVNSRLGHFIAAYLAVGTPSPEVTGLFCRVPLARFSRTPEAIRLIYLCRIVVRTITS
jgi:hypothetical protein